jgi:hypothetical protein
VTSRTIRKQVPAFSISAKASFVRRSILCMSSERRTRKSSISPSMRVDVNEITDDFGEMLFGGRGKTSWLSRGDDGMVIGGNSMNPISEGLSDAKTGIAYFWTNRARSRVVLCC